MSERVASESANSEVVVSDVACTVCGCVCDDLRMHVAQRRIVQAERACGLAEPWFLEQGSRTPAAAEIESQPSSIGDAVQRAVQILQSARAPLIYGLSRSSTDGQRAAVALADRIGANIDTTASLCHASSVMALQVVGEQTCTLGEVRNRADLVVFWGSNPVVSHPRHQERYSVFPTGEFRPGGRSDRMVIVADIKATPSTEQADLFLPIEPGRDLEALWTLRCLVQGIPVPPEASTGAPLDLLRDVAQRMKSCRFGIVFFGLGLSTTGLGHHNVEALLQLVRELNDYTRFYARRMRVQGDVTGADLVLAWQTGYPFSVNLSRGYPRYNPGEYSAQDLLEQGEVDACLFLGSEGVKRFSPAARDALRHVPTIVLDHPTVDSQVAPTVRFTTGVYGIHYAGTAYRMDEVPVPLRAVLPSEYPSDGEILRRMLESLPE